MNSFGLIASQARQDKMVHGWFMNKIWWANANGKFVNYYDRDPEKWHCPWQKLMQKWNANNIKIRPNNSHRFNVKNMICAQSARKCESDRCWGNFDYYFKSSSYRTHNSVKLHIRIRRIKAQSYMFSIAQADEKSCLTSWTRADENFMFD